MSNDIGMILLDLKVNVNQTVKQYSEYRHNGINGLKYKLWESS
jgi:hypothetical protein